MAAPSDTARLIQEAITQLGLPDDPEQLVEAVRRLDIGLPLEDEFSVICGWLGKCELLHKLDQQQVPISSNKVFQVPDIMAKFSTQNSETPLLIEVKSNQQKVLSFKPEYIDRLMR